MGITATPLTTSAYSLTEEGAGRAPPWEPALSNSLSSLFTFASPEAVYTAYAKLYFFVFLGFLLGLIGLHARYKEHAGRLERWGFGLSFVGLVLNLFGNVPDYWVGEDTIFEDAGFLVGTVLGFLVLTVGSFVLGTALLRAGRGPGLGAWLLVFALPGMIMLAFIGFGNIPSGPALWYGFVWVVLGYSLWSAERGAVRREDGLR